MEANMAKKQTKISENVKITALRRSIAPGLLTIFLYFSHIIVNAVFANGNTADSGADFLNTALFVLTITSGLWWAIELIYGVFMLNAKPVKKAAPARKKAAAPAKKRK